MLSNNNNTRSFYYKYKKYKSKYIAKLSIIGGQSKEININNTTQTKEQLINHLINSANHRKYRVA